MKDATIAFAGMLQASELVRQIASSGNCSQQAARASLASIFTLEPESTEAVYGGLGGVRMGLRVLVELFGARSNHESLQSLNLALAMAKLSRMILRDRERQQALGREIALIESAWQQSEDELDPCILSQLGDAYQSHVSNLPYRIQVHGRPEYLKQAEKVAYIRALLLSGIRSAILWHQLGGRQWRLVFQRRRMLDQAEQLLTA